MKSQKQNQKKKSFKRRTNVNVSSNDGISAQSNALSKLPRSVTNIIPDRLYTRLRYTGLQNLTILTTSTTAGIRYRPSAAFDIDPLLGSTATPGFAEFAAFYNGYRVTSSKIVVKAVNQINGSGQGVLMVVVPLNVDPTGSPSVAVVNSWIEQPYSIKNMIGVYGSPAVTLTETMSTEKIFGSKMVYFDDNFTSIVSSVPNNNWYWAIGAICATMPTTSLIVNLYVEIDIGIEFFSRKALLS
jgi:hypothetical protein